MSARRLCSSIQLGEVHGAPLKLSERIVCPLNMPYPEYGFELMEASHFLESALRAAVESHCRLVNHLLDLRILSSERLFLTNCEGGGSYP